MAKISIEAKQGVYLSYKNYPYEAPQVFGEFIDNAIQSNEDNEIKLKSMSPGHQLRVDISVQWYMDNKDKEVKSSKITIKDNAAGMTEDIFLHAFNLADDTVTRKGMNEFGIGMKAASAWFGNNWHFESTSIDDRITRVLDVDLTELATKQIKELDYKEIQNSSNCHGTTIEITNLWEENVIKQDSVNELIENIASIYRNFIRNDEIKIFFEEQLLTFDDYEVLKTPWYKTPDAEDIEWKTAVTFDDHEGHVISGFLALLNDMSEAKRGVVFTRNKRVVLGFDPKKRTVGKIFTGQIGSSKYRRVFGELEISGFSVAFGKNNLNDIDLLETLCKAVAGKAKIQGYNLLTQGDNYKARAKKKKQSKLKTNEPPKDTDKKDDNIISHPKAPIPSTQESGPIGIPSNVNPQSVVSEEKTSSKGVELLDSDIFDLNGKSYIIELIQGSESSDLFWNERDPLNENRLVCKVNIEHPFFVAYGQPSKPILSMIKALSIAKFNILEKGQTSASDMMNEFNIIINVLK